MTKMFGPSMGPFLCFPDTTMTTEKKGDFMTYNGTFRALALLAFAAFGLVSPTGFAKDLSAYDHLDPQHLIPDQPLRQAVTYFDANQSAFPNQNFLVVIDFSQNSSKKRFYLIDMKSGAVEAHLTAHGKGSDPDADGNATQFSNVDGSEQSSLGIYRTAEVYIGEHGKTLRLDGLSPTNSKARDRAIVLHPADYVSESDGHAGRSWGCPAVDPKISSALIDKIKNGAMLFAWTSK